MATQNEPPHGRTSDFTPRRAGDLSATLFAACGFLTLLLVPFGPARDHAEPIATLGVAVAAMCAGLVVKLLPWERWTLQATLWLIPVALVLVAGFNIFAVEPYLFLLYYLVTFLWIGVVHPRGTSLRFAPLLAVAYLAPAALAPEARFALLSAAYGIPVIVMVGEVLAWVQRGRREAEVARCQAHDRHEALVRWATDFVCVVADGRIAYAGNAVARLLDRDPEDLVGEPADMRVHPQDLPALMERITFAEMHPGEPSAPVEYRVADRGGDWIWVEARITDLSHEPSVGGLLINGRDVTERHEAQARMVHAAYHDDLTGLPNRVAFLEHLSDAVMGGRRCGLVFCDLDGFKVINDSLGHAVGDDLLVAVAARIAGSVSEHHQIARLGGDEFVVLCRDVREEADLVGVADRVIEALREPFRIIGRQLSVTTSAGVVLADAAGTTPDELLRRADLAMYRAKQLGKNRHHVYDDILGSEAATRLNLEDQLRRALDRSEFVLVYQTELDLQDGHIAAVEALLRWHHPDRGVVNPDDFIGVAEDCGLIIPLGRWVTRSAIDQAARWWQELGDSAPAVSINVSPYQLADDGFHDVVAAALESSGIPPYLVRLELTETILADPGQVQPWLARMRDLGVVLAIDDFGTGYSSLSYLHTFPVDVVKIDQSFLAGVREPDDRAQVVEAIIAMAHSLGLCAVAEGVEHPGQVSLLRRLGCDRAQGFLFSRPEDPRLVSGLLRLAAHRDDSVGAEGIPEVEAEALHDG